MKAIQQRLIVTTLAFAITSVPVPALADLRVGGGGVPGITPPVESLPDRSVLTSNASLTTIGANEMPAELQTTISGARVLRAAAENGAGQVALRGSGTQESPYLITSVNDLHEVGKLYPGARAGLSFRLESDIVVHKGDLVSYSDPWGDTEKAIVSRLRNATFDGNGHTITVSSADSGVVLFGDIRNSSIKDLVVAFDGRNSSITYFSLGCTFQNVVTVGELEWASANYGAFVIYPYDSNTFINCTNKARIQTTNGDSEGLRVWCSL